MKKLKLRQIEEEVEEKIRKISFGGEYYYTVDEDMPEVEEEIHVSSWSDCQQQFP